MSKIHLVSFLGPCHCCSCEERKRTLVGDRRSNGKSSHGKDGGDNGELHFENSV